LPPTIETDALREGDVLTLRIKRWDPSTETAPRYETVQVPYSDRMRILDALEFANERLGADVAYRWFCGARRCGMCAMVVNGEAKLTCWEPAQRTMTIEPLHNLPVVRDLVIDRAPYEEALQRMQPRIQRGAPYPGFPEPLPDMEEVNRLSDCIECLVCYSSCPAMGKPDSGFLGPTTLVQLGRFVLDVRDQRDLTQIRLTDAQVDHCRACAACETTCPVDIPILSAIESVKARIDLAAR
jgi:fumarate reductase (CoM/CoB) subunit B